VFCIVGLTVGLAYVVFPRGPRSVVREHILIAALWVVVLKVLVAGPILLRCNSCWTMLYMPVLQVLNEERPAWPLNWMSSIMVPIGITWTVTGNLSQGWSTWLWCYAWPVVILHCFWYTTTRWPIKCLNDSKWSWTVQHFVSDSKC